MVIFVSNESQMKGILWNLMENGNENYQYVSKITKSFSSSRYRKVIQNLKAWIWVSKMQSCNTVLVTPHFYSLTHFPLSLRNMYLLPVVEKTRRCRKYPPSQSCFRSTLTSCGEKYVFFLPMHLSAIKVSADRQFWARAKLIWGIHIRRQDMGYYKRYVAKIWMTGSCSTLKDLLTKGKDIPQNAKSPLWLSYLSVLSICRPTCVTWQKSTRRNHETSRNHSSFPIWLLALAQLYWEGLSGTF